MITLNASGGSVTFEFSGNSTYLNDGQITVPVNSLALIIDESDMATFRKAASNDIFVSANIAEFGMTKDELMAWYKANMVGSTGGGKAIEGGRGISVTTGATADTVSLNIPISSGTGTYSIQENAGTALGEKSHAEGSNTTAYGDYSHAEGYNTMAISAYSHTEGWQTQANGLAAHAEGYTTHADGEKSHAEGNLTETKNLGEHASGSYNLSHKASNTFGDSGNTLFSVGNGTSTGTSRHNAFEIRQNGDIYFEYDGADTKLQDKLDEIETVTAAALNNLNNKFGGLSLVKLTQTEYDNLQTKDSNTLYVIVG